eukprot:scaffold71690_cov32-Tisochrysis_lutea.AAC.3
MVGHKSTHSCRNRATPDLEASRRQSHSTAHASLQRTSSGGATPQASLRRLLRMCRCRRVWLRTQLGRQALLSSILQRRSESSPRIGGFTTSAPCASSLMLYRSPASSMLNDDSSTDRSILSTRLLTCRAQCDGSSCDTRTMASGLHRVSTEIEHGQADRGCLRPPRGVRRACALKHGERRKRVKRPALIEQQPLHLVAALAREAAEYAHLAEHRVAKQPEPVRLARLARLARLGERRRGSGGAGVAHRRERRTGTLHHPPAANTLGANSFTF